MAIDWTAPMQQVLAYYEVDPVTWRDIRQIDTVVSCTVTRDSSTPTLESARFAIDGEPMGEGWVRCYLDATQDGQEERVPVGTWIVQTPIRKLDGRVEELSAIAYSVLHPLREAMPPVGFSLPTGADCAEQAASCLEHGPAPVQGCNGGTKLSEPYVAPISASWLDVACTLAASAGLTVGFDGTGTIHLTPSTPASALLPTWSFRDDESSILLPEASDSDDWYGMPNVCTVVCGHMVGRAVNDDPGSAVSTVSRGREVELRVTDPKELKEGCTQEEVDLAARMRLQEASCMERAVVISHGFCPVGLGNCIDLDYRAMRLAGNAVVTRQVVELSTGVKIDTTAALKQQMWSA